LANLLRDCSSCDKDDAEALADMEEMGILLILAEYLERRTPRFRRFHGKIPILKPLAALS
jgi:hypothetical protein